MFGSVSCRLNSLIPQHEHVVSRDGVQRVVSAQRNDAVVEDWAQSLALKRRGSRNSRPTRLWQGDTDVSSAPSTSSGKICSQKMVLGCHCAVSLCVAGANVDLISCGPAMSFMYTREKAIRNYSIAVNTHVQKLKTLAEKPA